MGAVPALNFLGNIRDKKFYSRSYYALEGDINQPGTGQKDDGRKKGAEYGSRVELKYASASASDVSYTGTSVSDGGGDGGGGTRECPYVCIPREPEPCSASSVLVELKADVTRLIDESIQKIEQTWAREIAVETRDAAEQATPDEMPIEPDTHADAAVGSILPDDGDGDHDEISMDYRKQNLLVLKSKPFKECTSRTRLKLLQEIQILVKRLKDMEKLE
ncbi:hypothetical protein AND_003793 [Anopheles darlingi]|uniref:Uncharacterized protein n=1 Tax=Anopheles darlingi TaxID=43151 RepID=W5JNY4_ANODA|nr:hypothetical protein AND_003793 [Anopheles darlingi]